MPSSKCPKCGAIVGSYRNPFPTVDIIIPMEQEEKLGPHIVIIKRKNPPYGWAIPGGFIDYGEKAEDAAVREAKEETSLDITGVQLFGVYSDPSRDPRAHTMSIVYEAIDDIYGTPEARDDATEIRLVPIRTLLMGNEYPLAFDHRQILTDWWEKFLSNSPFYDPIDANF